MPGQTVIVKKKNSHGEVGDVGVSGLTRSVGSHDTPTGGLSELDATVGRTCRYQRLCVTILTPRRLLFSRPCQKKNHSRLDGLGDRTDLVDLQQQTVTSLLLDGGLDPQRVGDSQIITDDLNTSRSGVVRPSLPIVLVKGVLDRTDIVFLAVTVVEISELGTGDPFGWIRVGVLRGRGKPGGRKVRTTETNAPIRR